MKKIILLAAISFGVAIAAAIYLDLYVSFCADCPPGIDIDKVVYFLLGEEAAVAGLIFFGGGLVGLWLGRRPGDA